MAIFYRIYNNKLFSAGEVSKIGFPEQDAFYIPDEYLHHGNFLVMRTCHGIGDWCLLTAMPRLLKAKYPECKVYIPSSQMLQNVFGTLLSNWGYGTYDCSKVTLDLFKNNPYIDGYVDSMEGEIYHDHFRVYNSEDTKVPLVEQMLKFWQFQHSEMADSMPEIYFSKEEIEEGEKIIKELFNKNIYNYISVSSTYGETAESDILLDKIKKHQSDYKWLYYGEKPLTETNLNFLKDCVEVKPMNLTIRQQMYLKTRASMNFGNETGMNIWSARYSKTFILNNRYYGSNHGGKNEGKPRKDPFSSGNFVRNINYI